MTDNYVTKIFNKECTFVMGVASLSQLPQGNIPEFAFWGRSNVGKSSLINALINRKNFVRVSNTPGRTRELNYFTIQDYFYLVDLPGYGYAKVAKTLKIEWNKLVLGYIEKSFNLKRIFLLIDAKVGFKTLDLEIMQFLNYYGRSYQLVFTKTDKIKAYQLQELQEYTKEQIIPKNPACFSQIITTSSKEKVGIEEIKKAIVELL